MSSIQHISGETMKHKSVIATHTSLIEIGRFEEAQKNREKQQEIENIEVIKFLEKYNKVIEEYEETNSTLSNKKCHTFNNSDTFKEIINKSLNHIIKLNKIIDENNNKYNKLQEENIEFKDETKELINQTEELEQQIENITEIKDQRIEKLRNICIKRNKTIKILKKILLVTFLQLCIINYIGFANYYYTIKYIVIGYYHIFNSIYKNTIFIYNNPYYYINKVNITGYTYILEFCYLICNLVYGFIQVYSAIFYEIYKFISNYFINDVSIDNIYYNNSNLMCYI